MLVLRTIDYETNLARRRYEAVDPENRLVAATLESEWNDKLVVLQQAKKEYEKYFPKGEKPSLTVTQIKEILKTLKEQWQSATISIQDKKEIIRCLIERVLINTEGKILSVEIIWHGQTITKLDVPKYLFSSSHIYNRVKELALSHIDSEIAEILNQNKLLTVKQKPWTSRRVMDFRLSNKIASGFTRTESLKVDKGYVSSQEAAEILNADVSAIQRWFKLGILEGKRGEGAQSPLWIYLDDSIIKRLNGSADFDLTIRTFRSLLKDQQMSKEELIKWVKLNDHEILRLKRGKIFHFYIRPKNKEQLR